MITPKPDMIITADENLCTPSAMDQGYGMDELSKTHHSSFSSLDFFPEPDTMEIKDSDFANEAKLCEPTSALLADSIIHPLSPPRSTARGRKMVLVEVVEDTPSRQDENRVDSSGIHFPRMLTDDTEGEETDSWEKVLYQLSDEIQGAEEFLPPPRSLTKRVTSAPSVSTRKLMTALKRHISQGGIGAPQLKRRKSSQLHSSTEDEALTSSSSNSKLKLKMPQLPRFVETEQARIAREVSSRDPRRDGAYDSERDSDKSCTEPASNSSANTKFINKASMNSSDSRSQHPQGEEVQQQESQALHVFPQHAYGLPQHVERRQSSPRGGLTLHQHGASPPQLLGQGSSPSMDSAHQPQGTTYQPPFTYASPQPSGSVPIHAGSPQPHSSLPPQPHTGGQVGPSHLHGAASSRASQQGRLTPPQHYRTAPPPHKRGLVLLHPTGASPGQTQVSGRRSPGQAGYAKQDCRIATNPVKSAEAQAQKLVHQIIGMRIPQIVGHGKIYRSMKYSPDLSKQASAFWKAYNFFQAQGIKTNVDIGYQYSVNGKPYVPPEKSLLPGVCTFNDPFAFYPQESDEQPKGQVQGRLVARLAGSLMQSPTAISTLNSADAARVTAVEMPLRRSRVQILSTSDQCLPLMTFDAGTVVDLYDNESYGNLILYDYHKRLQQELDAVFNPGVTTPVPFPLPSDHIEYQQM